MARRPTRNLVDLVLHGTLDSELATRRHARHTFDEIARWLDSEHGVEVSSETVRMWCIDLGIHEVAS